MDIICAVALLRPCQERAKHHPFWCCCSPSLLTMQPWNVLSQCKHTDPQQTLKMTILFCTDIDGQDAENPCGGLEGEEEGLEAGTENGYPRNGSGERMCSLTQPFCQALTPKGSVPVPKQPEPHGCSVKGKRLKGKRLTGIVPG